MSRKYWNEQEDELLKVLVAAGDIDCRQIGKLLNRTKVAIYGRVQKLGLEVKYQYHIYEYNRNYFKALTYDNVMLGGFLAADGSIWPEGSQWVLSWVMNEKDEQFLQFFKDQIKYTGPIRHHEVVTEKGTLCKFAQLALRGVREMKDDLATLGITHNKTLRLVEPILPSLELKLAYVLGYTFGDGCVNLSNGIFTISWTSSSPFVLAWIRNIIISLNLPSAKRRAMPNVRPCGRGRDANIFSIGGLKAMYLLELLKRVPTVQMDRKMNQPKVLAFIEEYKATRPQYFTLTVDQLMTRNNISFPEIHKIPENSCILQQQTEPITI